MWLQCFSRGTKTDKLKKIKSQQINASKGKQNNRKVKNKVTWLENVNNPSDEEKCSKDLLPSETPNNSHLKSNSADVPEEPLPKDGPYCGTVQSHQVTFQKSFAQIITISTSADSDSSSDSGHDSRSNSISLVSYSGVTSSSGTSAKSSMPKQTNLRAEILMAARTPSGTLPRAVSRVKRPSLSSAFKSEANK